MTVLRNYVELAFSDVQNEIPESALNLVYQGHPALSGGTDQETADVEDEADDDALTKPTPSEEDLRWAQLHTAWTPGTGGLHGAKVGPVDGWWELKGGKLTKVEPGNVASGGPAESDKGTGKGDGETTEKADGDQKTAEKAESGDEKTAEKADGDEKTAEKADGDAQSPTPEGAVD